ncbi:ubiquinone biosynthesis protein UbiB [Candidatus Pelagibacter sp.]|uniref:ubiquinone biosynthesis protein UbiB n=1 Tax=Candidatus Pelagibacter sp. TaxID=2024849 RepID=UPI003F8340A4
MRVCILGSNLTSLTLAKALVNQNINVEIFTNKKKQIINFSRTIGITKSNIEYFNKNIVNIDKIIWQLRKIEIFSEKLKQEKLLNFENNNEQLFSIVSNYKLYNILEKSLIKNKYFKKNYKKILLSNIKNYDLVINLEFSNFISKKFFSKKIVKRYNSIAYTGILRHKKIENKVARQFFTKIGPLAFLPISENETSVVYSINHSNEFKRATLVNLINHYNSIYKIEKITKISSFKLSSLNLRSYYYKNILAFGDLLHKIHPLAGQGYNMTIRDIKVLLEIIKSKKNLGLPLNVSVNQEFQRITKHKNFIFSKAIDSIYEFFNFERKVKGNSLVNSLKYLGHNQSINKIFKKIADIGFA